MWDGPGTSATIANSGSPKARQEAYDLPDKMTRPGGKRSKRFTPEIKRGRAPAKRVR